MWTIKPIRGCRSKILMQRFLNPGISSSATSSRQRKPRLIITSHSETPATYHVWRKRKTIKMSSAGERSWCLHQHDLNTTRMLSHISRSNLSHRLLAQPAVLWSKIANVHQRKRFQKKTKHRASAWVKRAVKSANRTDQPAAPTQNLTHRTAYLQEPFKRHGGAVVCRNDALLASKQSVWLSLAEETSKARSVTGNREAHVSVSARTHRELKAAKHDNIPSTDQNQAQCQAACNTCQMEYNHRKTGKAAGC